MSAADTTFSVFSFITLVLVLIPFPWHLKARNVGTCLYMLWTALGLISCFVNSIIWRDNVTDYASARVWCDITTRILVGTNLAIPAAALCISHRLYCMVSLRSASRTDTEKCFDMIVDLAIGGGFPLVCIGLYYVVQGHRFDIFEGVGCWPVITDTPATLLVFAMWPILIGLISAFYSVKNLMAFRKRRAELRELLSTLSNHNANNYNRLMALSAVDIACCIPLSIANIITDAKNGTSWMSWADIHYDFSSIGQIPAHFWRSDPAIEQALERSRWLVVGCGLVFIAFFGFSKEAQDHYKHALSSVAKYVGYTTNSSSKVGIEKHTPESAKFKRSSHGTSSNGVNSQAQGSIIGGQEVIENPDSMDFCSEIASMRDGEYNAERNSKPGSDHLVDKV